MKNVLIYVETFLPASQAFIVNQVKSFKRFDSEIMAGKRTSTVHDTTGRVKISSIRESASMRAGELLLKVPRLAVPALFPPLSRADLVHAHFGKNGYVIAPLAKAAGLPLVTTFHGFDATYQGDPKTPGGFNQVRFFAGGRQELARSNTWNIAVSDFITDKLLALGFPRERIYRHYIGIDTSLFQVPSKPRRKGLVVSIARFVEYKGHKLMIEALAKVAAQGIPVEFAMVGQGPLRDEMEVMARKLLPKVTMFENLTQAQIRDLLCEAEIYVHGSVTLANGHAEAFGLANLEAEAVGTPVVAFRSGGVGEAIEDGATGFLVAERDITGMADAIGKLLTNPELWASFSRRAPVMVSTRFDITRQTGLLEDYYGTVIDAYKKGQ